MGFEAGDKPQLWGVYKLFSHTEGWREGDSSPPPLSKMKVQMISLHTVPERRTYDQHEAQMQIQGLTATSTENTNSFWSEARDVGQKEKIESESY